MEKKIKIEKDFIISNRKASFEYVFLEEYDAGIVLLGSEIKSIRNGGASISEAYCYVKKGEIFIRNMHISDLKNAVIPHEPTRERKLLLRKKEINKISSELKNQGLTLIPTLLYNKKGLAKLKVKLSKGKKIYDKRQSIKSKDIERELKKNDS